MKRQPIPLLTVFAISVFAQLSSAALPSYEIIDLGTLGGGQSEAWSINDIGQIIGWAYNQQRLRHATLFDPSGSGNNIDLGTLGGNGSGAYSINNSGQIVGTAKNSSGNSYATLFDPTGNGSNVDLGTLSGYPLSAARCISDNGQIVGYSLVVEGSYYHYRATLFDSTGSGNNIDLGTLGGERSRAYSISNSGQIVGSATNSSGNTRATLFDSTGTGNNIDLGTLGGTYSEAMSINNNEQIVGVSRNTSADNRATLFDATGDGNNIDLGTLSGFSSSYAWSINDRGQIVGDALFFGGGPDYNRATLFDPTGNGNNINLNTLIDPAGGWTLNRVISINNSGWIVGAGLNPHGERHAYLLIPILPKPPTIYYVDVDAGGANDGSSWEDAFNYLQDALTAAWSGDEIWVAQGTYKPDMGARITHGDRRATFRLKNGVAIKGGYAGYGESDPNARDIELYETILTGDLNGNDVDVNDPTDLPYELTRRDNSYHVVTGSRTDANSVLDGFTITAGNANRLHLSRNNSGGGMYNYAGSPTVTNCSFRVNSAIFHGGGMDNEDSSPKITNCIFSGNYASSNGGGMSNQYSSPALDKCTFNGNLADYSGGGMHNMQSYPTLSGCSFSGNRVRLNGVGGIYCDGGGGGIYCESSSPTITNCSFTGNSAGAGGGICIYGCPLPPPMPPPPESVGELSSPEILSDYNLPGPTITNCIFSENAALLGGGMCNSNSSARLTNCTFSGNSAGAGGGIYCQYGGIPPMESGTTIVHELIITNSILWGDTPQEIHGSSGKLLLTYSDVQGGWPGEGNIDADPCFVEPGYWDVNGVWVEGDYHLLEDSPCINAGDPNYVAEPNETDLDGRPRVLMGRIDMGAYEFNHIPVADAGDDQIVECACNTQQGTKVTLDGTRSYDPDGDLLTYTWMGPFDESPAHGPTPTVTLLDGCPGEYVITLVVNDGIDNSEPNDVVITVVDTTPPVITCPADITLECPADTSVEANGSATASDTCGSVTITHSDQWQPDCGNTGTLMRTWTATDEYENSSTCVQTITVVDTTPPDFEFSVTPSILWPPNHKMVLITPSWTVSDECDATPDVSLVGIVANEGDDTIGDGHTTDDIQIGDDGAIYLRAERSGTGNDRVYTITYQAVDDCGNATVCSATVSIPHDFKVLARIAARWLWTGPAGRIPEDLNGDGAINFTDFSKFAENWIK